MLRSSVLRPSLLRLRTIARRFRRLRSDRRGSILPTFALLLPLILIACGLGIDGARFIDSRRAVLQAADASALAMITDFRRSYVQNAADATSPAGIFRSKSKAITLFHRNVEQLPDSVKVNFKADIAVSGTQFTGIVDFTGTYSPVILKVFGKDSVPLSGTVTVTASALPYMEVTLLVDTSASMGIGVDAPAQAQLTNLTGCAFACHDNVPFRGYADTFTFARANNITLRYDAINTALDRLIGNIAALDPSGKYIKASIWSFDTNFRQTAALTNSVTQLRNALPQVTLATDERHAATRFKEGIGQVVQAIGKGGDGSSPRTPIKVFILATDGVQDPGRYWTWDVPAQQEVDAFDMSFCTSMKGDKVKIGIVHTPYLPLPYDWGFAATLGMSSTRGGPGTRLDDVTPALQSCAEGNYHVANDEKSIIDGFQKIFSNSIIPRLTN